MFQEQSLNFTCKSAGTPGSKWM